MRFSQLQNVRVWAIAAIAAGGVASSMSAEAADLPAPAKKIVEAMKLGPDVTRDWEREHIVPKAMLDAARKEGEVRITGSWKPSEWDQMIEGFRLRYPFINVKYTRGSHNARSRVPLIAYMQGRYVTDFLTGIDTEIEGYKKANALESLKDVPNRANIPAQFGGAQDTWSGIRMRFYCLSYNTKLVKKSELPKTWGDLTSSPAFREGKLGIWYGIASWLLPIWGEKGEAWTTDFINKLFLDAKAQKRKEGATALVSLMGAGEFHGVLATAEYNVAKHAEKGAPVGFHCADLVMATTSSVGILRGSPNRHAGKLFLNWLLSKEGQLAQSYYDGAPPIHKDLQRKEFIPFADEIIGKKVSFRTPELLGEELPKLQKVWNPFWSGGK